ncbi:MAG TPA: hypothetical protein VFF04_06565 [Candidatus Babeliales bacterium]|nr:hypothetical protein [Candidatus Babeliales bacterium]
MHVKSLLLLLSLSNVLYCAEAVSLTPLDTQAIELFLSFSKKHEEKKPYPYSDKRYISCVQYITPGSDLVDLRIQMATPKPKQCQDIASILANAHPESFVKAFTESVKTKITNKTSMVICQLCQQKRVHKAWQDFSICPCCSNKQQIPEPIIFTPKSMGNIVQDGKQIVAFYLRRDIPVALIEAMKRSEQKTAEE